MGPLTGIRVLEVGGIGPVPFCGMLLGDFGAEVVRIERPGVSPAESEAEPGGILGRNKKVIGVNLKHPAVGPVLTALVQRADVLLEGFRPGVMERLGWSPEICAGLNPRLVFGRMTGWGREGPLAQAPGHDINYISIIGLLRTVGRRDKPVPPLNLTGDYGGGGLLLALGVCAALYERQGSGKGQVVDAAMSDGAALLMNTVYELMQRGEWSAERESNLLDGGAHFYGTYETSDGEFVSIAASEPQFYRALLEELGLAQDRELQGEQMNRVKWPQFRERIAAVFRARTRADWNARLLEKGVCYAPVLSFEEAQTFPHNHARQQFVKAGAFIQAAPAPRFGRTALAPPQPAARLGTCTATILAEAGLPQDTVRQLLQSGVIA